MKAVLISIQPKWCELIASGEKLVEIRKTKPKIETPFKCYIYCTQGKGITDNFRLENNDLGNSKVIGEFVCDNIAKGTSQLGSCLSMQEISKYANGKEIYGWHISDLVIYDKPKALSEFKKYCNGVCVDTKIQKKCQRILVDGFSCDGLLPITRPPQSWCYVEELR